MAEVFKDKLPSNPDPNLEKIQLKHLLCMSSGFGDVYKRQHALDLTLWMMDNYEVQSVTGASFHKLSDQTCLLYTSFSH